MRYEVILGFVIGILLPLLETYRRGVSHWLISFMTMFEDYVGGALLLIGAVGTYYQKAWGLPFLLVAWAVVTGMLGVSFGYQLEETIRGLADEPYNVSVVAIKFILLALSSVALTLTFRRLLKTIRLTHEGE